jgi:peptidoglycan/xylan/chitin deacetylase (PgdA/CDA1 family)
MSFYAALTAVVFIAGAAVVLTAFVAHSVLQEYRKDRVPALLYHHFVRKESGDESPRKNYDPVYFCYDTAFEEQLQLLRQEGYTTISLDDFTAFQEGKKSLPPKPVILTFDDGFMSNYLYAFPLLQKYGMTATIFATPDSNAENFKKYADVDLPLTHEQLKEMSACGIAIESHGMTHRYLTELEPEVTRWELEESKNALERLLKKPVHYIAIPSGAYNKTVKRMVKEAGYKAAFCMLKGTNNRQSDRHALRRLVIGRDFSLEDFRLTLRPATACYLRLAGSAQNALLSLLGPAGLDAFRNFLYRSRLGKSVIRGQLRYLVPAIGAVIFFIVIVGLLILLRR